MGFPGFVHILDKMLHTIRYVYFSVGQEVQLSNELSVEKGIGSDRGVPSFAWSLIVGSNGDVQFLRLATPYVFNISRKNFLCEIISSSSL